MIRSLPLVLLPFALAACSTPPPAAAAPDPRLQVKILYVLEDGGVFRYDELTTAAERRNWREVRSECDATFTRYSFTVHEEDPSHWWTSL